MHPEPARPERVVAVALAVDLLLKSSRIYMEIAVVRMMLLWTHRTAALSLEVKLRPGGVAVLRVKGDAHRVERHADLAVRHDPAEARHRLRVRLKAVPNP